MSIIFRGKPLTSARVKGALRHHYRTIFPKPPQPPPPFRPVPWITDKSIDAIEQFLGECARAGQPVNALEFGAGASTIWLAHRVKSLVSFEHNEAWYSEIVSRIEQDGLQNVDVRRYELPYFEYVDDLPDATFDLILVDGRDRVECIRRSTRKLAPGGLLVLDNSERIGKCEAPGRYIEVLDILSGWDRSDYVQTGPDRTGWVANHIWMTTVWRRVDPVRTDER